MMRIPDRLNLLDCDGAQRKNSTPIGSSPFSRRLKIFFARRRLVER
jgi:hypothetical protein